MDRDLQYDAAPVSATSRAPITACTLVPTWTVGDRYLVVATCAVNESTTTVSAELHVDGSPSFGFDIAPKDFTNDYFACPMVFPRTVQTGAETLELIVDSAASAPDPGATVRQAQLAVFKLTDLDVTNADHASAGSSTTNTTYTTVTGSTCTIPEAGEYLIVACAQVGKGELTANFNIRLALNGTTAYGDQTMRANSTTKNFPWATMVKLTLAAGDVLTIEHKVTTTGTVSTAYASIVALRVNNMPQVQEVEDFTTDADNSTTSTTYADIVDVSQTSFMLQAFPSLVLSCAHIRRGGIAVDASIQTLVDGATVLESRHETVTNNTEQTHFAVHPFTPSQGAHTIKQQWRSEGGGITAAIHQDSAIAILCLEDNATVRIFGGNILGANIV